MPKMCFSWRLRADTKRTCKTCSVPAPPNRLTQINRLQALVGLLQYSETEEVCVKRDVQHHLSYRNVSHNFYSVMADTSRRHEVSFVCFFINTSFFPKSNEEYS